jgi:Leucine-rich repeat (LRR) protein
MFATRFAAFLLALAALLPGGSRAPAAHQPPKVSDDDVKDLDTTLKFLDYGVLAARRDGKWDVILVGTDTKKLTQAIALVKKLDADVNVLDAGALTDELLAELVQVDRMTSLALTLNTNLTDEGLAHLKKAKGLTELRVELCTRVTAAGVKHVAALERLTRLSITLFLADDDWINPVAGMTNLVALRLDGCQLSDAQLGRLATLKNLKELSLARNNRLSASGLAKLAPLSKLESLDVTALPLSDADLDVLKQWPNLNRLVLKDTKLTDAGLPRVARAKGLRHLDLTNTKVAGTGFEAVGQLADLEVLILSGTAVAGEGFDHLGKLTKLKQIGLRRLPKLTGEGLDHLAKCPDLTTLDLSQTGLGDAGLAKVGKLKQLKVLALPNYAVRTRPAPDEPFNAKPFNLTDDGRLTDAGLKPVAGLSDLVELSVGGKELTDDGLARLTALTNLRKLTLGPVPGVKGKALAKFTTVVELNLSDSGLPDEALGNLVGLTNLKRLWLPKTATPGAAEHLKGMKGLEAVYFWEQFGPKGAAALRKNLPDFPSIRPAIPD